jgi:hypothetical protein
MPPWAFQAEFESGLRSLRKASASRILELTALALDEPRASYKGVAGALTHGIRKAKRRHRCGRLRACARALRLPRAAATGRAPRRRCAAAAAARARGVAGGTTAATRC